MDDGRYGGGFLGLLSGTTTGPPPRISFDTTLAPTSSTPTAVNPPPASHGTQHGSRSLAWPPSHHHTLTGYTSNWTSTGVAIPGIVTIWRAGRDGQSPSAPHLPLFDRLGPFAIDGHGNSSWTAQQRHGERTNTFSGFNEAALAAPPSDAQMIPRHWPLGPARRKPCGPSCITYTFGVCVRPQEMLCSSQTRSRKPTERRRVEIPIINALSAAPQA